jgi:hypothetical protein
VKVTTAKSITPYGEVAFSVAQLPARPNFPQMIRKASVSPDSMGNTPSFSYQKVQPQ